MKLAIYHTTDLHGYVYPTNYISEQNLGILKIGSYILEDEKSYDASLKVDCGDLIQGSPLTHYLSKQTYENNIVIDAMNTIGYDAFVVGNHEFNYGLDYFYSAYKGIANKIINANIIGLNIDTKPYRIFNYNGFRIACIGLTTSFIPNWENEGNIKGLKFLDPVDVYRQYEDEMKANSDFIIVCYHGGFEKSLDSDMIPTEKLTKENQASELLENFSSINMILSGHQHRSFITSINGVVCSQPMNNGQNFGRIILDTETKEVNYELVDVKTLQVEISSELEDIFTEENVGLQEYLDKQIGNFDKDLVIDDVFYARLNGHPYINFLHDVQLEASGADFSALSLFDNAIGFKKNVSVRDAIINYPYPNTLKVLKITGHQLKEAIEKAATYFVIENGKVEVNNDFIVPKRQHYNYDMFGGLTYEIDLNRDFYDRVVSIKRDGQELDLDKYYTIVVNNYRATNTSIYPSYENAELVKEVNVDVGELIINYFLNHKMIKVNNDCNYIIKY
ncbi:MAG: bifunctional metallophosphatase/5'-nucleotidase [Peptostreptococcaceae bacterium]